MLNFIFMYTDKNYFIKEKEKFVTSNARRLPAHTHIHARIVKIMGKNWWRTHVERRWHSPALLKKKTTSVRVIKGYSVELAHRIKYVRDQKERASALLKYAGPFQGSFEIKKLKIEKKMF